MTAAEVGGLLERDMAAAVTQALSEGINTNEANAATIKARIVAARTAALVEIFTPWLGSGVAAGYVSFTKDANHATVTNYEARLRAVGSSTVLATQSLGVPAPNDYHAITADLSTLYSGRTGNFTVSIARTTPSGTLDSTVSDAFTLPL